MAILINGFLGPYIIGGITENEYCNSSNDVIDSYNDESFKDIVNFIERHKENYIMSWFIEEISKKSYLKNTEINKLKTMYKI